MSVLIDGRQMTVAAAAREGRRRSLPVAIEDLMRRWANENPEFVLRFAAAMKEERKNLKYATGLSRDRHFMARGSIPGRLNTMMCREIDKNWMDDPECVRIFWDLFKVGRINPRAAVGRWTR